MTQWTPADIKAHIEFQQALNAELLERGELVDAQGLAGPEQAKFVTSDGASAPVITDGPFPESKELLAGYRIVDVESDERAGPRGVTGRQTADLLRDLAPRALGAVVRRYGHFADAEDAVQEALLAAATAWPADGMPDNPLAWLILVASRKMADQYRRDEARRRREELAASWSLIPAGPAAAHDDTLTLMLMCCHPALSPGAAIPLTLRAVGGLTSREIAAAFLVPEATMAQRISRAKAKLKGFDEPFALPPPGGGGERLRSVLHVLYLIFNEGYATSDGADLARADLSGEAVRLARGMHAALPADAEVTGLLALMLLTDARRPARTGPGGELVPLETQDRSRWDRQLITEGLTLISAALPRGAVGDYQLQAAVAAVHDEAATAE